MIITLINLLLRFAQPGGLGVFCRYQSLQDLLTFGSRMNDLPELITAVLSDTMNSFFIVVLIAIAISTIIRFQQYNFRSTLPRLILAAFLVNFSRTICLLAINASNSLMTTFGSAVAEALPIFAIGLRLPAVVAFDDLTLNGLFGIDKVIKDAGEADSSAATGEFSLTITTIFGLLVALVATGAIVFFSSCSSSGDRIMVFNDFIPIAFFVGVPGRASSYWGQWLNEFVQHCRWSSRCFLYIIS